MGKLLSLRNTEAYGMGPNWMQVFLLYKEELSSPCLRIFLVQSSRSQLQLAIVICSPMDGARIATFLQCFGENANISFSDFAWMPPGQQPYHPVDQDWLHTEARQG